MEPLTDFENLKFSLYPIKYLNIWEHYKKQLSAFWKAEEIDFSQDRKNFETLGENEQYVIKMILAFFANTDGIVNLNISKRMMDLITINEVRYTYQYQMAMENIHSEVYSLMIDNLISNPSERTRLLDSIKTIPTIKEISNWAFRWIDSPVSIAHRIIAFGCIEGILFSGAFATIYWFKKRFNAGPSFLNGLIKSNEFISRDEGLHCEFAFEIYNLVVNRLSEEEAHKIIIEAVNVSQQFNDEALKIKLVGLNNVLMNQYIEYIADRLSVSFGYSKIYRATNPFTFMETIGMVQKTNFHESRPTEYQSAHNSFHTNNDIKFLSEDEF